MLDLLKLSYGLHWWLDTRHEVWALMELVVEIIEVRLVVLFALSIDIDRSDV